MRFLLKVQVLFVKQYILHVNNLHNLHRNKLTQICRMLVLTDFEKDTRISQK